MPKSSASGKDPTDRKADRKKDKDPNDKKAERQRADAWKDVMQELKPSEKKGKKRRESSIKSSKYKSGSRRPHHRSNSSESKVNMTVTPSKSPTDASLSTDSSLSGVGKKVHLHDAKGSSKRGGSGRRPQTIGRARGVEWFGELETCDVERVESDLPTKLSNSAEKKEKYDVHIVDREYPSRREARSTSIGSKRGKQKRANSVEAKRDNSVERKREQHVETRILPPTTTRNIHAQRRMPSGEGHSRQAPRSGLITDALVIELKPEHEHFGDAMMAFLDAFYRKSDGGPRPSVYKGECRVVKHGWGTHVNAMGNESQGVWAYNVFKGGSSRDKSPRQKLDILGPKDFLEYDEEDLGADGISSPPLSPPRSPPRLSILPLVRMPSLDLASTTNPFGSAGQFADELLIYVFSFLDLPSLIQASCVSTEWRRLTNDSLLWCEFYDRTWGMYGFQAERESMEVTRDWKETVKSRYLLERNWVNGNYHASTLRAHTGWVTAVDFSANKLVSSSYDGTVRVWNTQTGNTLTTLKNQTTPGILSPVWCLGFDSITNRIMTGSSDSKVREFDLATGQVVHVFDEHSGGVKCLQFSSSLLMSGSDDQTIKVFDRKSGRCVKTIEVPGPASCLQFQENVLCCASKREKEVYVIDLKRDHSRDGGAVARVFEGHSKPVYCLQFDLALNRLVTGSRDRNIYVWDFEMGKVVKKLVGHRYAVMTLQFDQSKVVSGGADEQVRIWDVNTGECVQILHGHKEMVTSVRFDMTKIVSGSADRTCTVYDFVRGNDSHISAFSFFE